MDRRAFVRGLFGVAAAAAVLGAATGEAAAAPLPVQKPEAAPQEENRTEADYRPDVDGVPSSGNVQYYYRRRRPVVWRRRRRVYRRRYVYRRPIYRTRPVYRRRVYYRRPIYVRPRYYWGLSERSGSTKGILPA